MCHQQLIVLRLQSPADQSKMSTLVNDQSETLNQWFLTGGEFRIFREKCLGVSKKICAALSKKCIFVNIFNLGVLLLMLSYSKREI